MVTMINAPDEHTAYKKIPKGYTIPVGDPKKLKKGDRIAFIGPVHKAGKGGPKVVHWHTLTGTVLNPNWKFGTMTRIDEDRAGIIHRKHKEIKQMPAFIEPRKNTFRGWLDSDEDTRAEIDKMPDRMAEVGKRLSEGGVPLRRVVEAMKERRRKEPGPFTAWLIPKNDDQYGDQN